ncbi:MAG TPA: potassium/proton antiporter [Clostridia bacterium]|nr:potassium/proton antiporter [Clostridia bacterium]
MILFLALLLILATFSTKLAAPLGIPGLIVFLGLGMIFGSGGFNLIDFNDPIMAQQIAIAALIIILFEGGFNTKRSLLKIAVGPSFSLATIGVIITAVTLGLTSHWVLGLSLPYALLVGSIISSTDAAAVFALFRNKNIQPKTAATLEIESAANDPMAIILTVIMIDYIQGALTEPQLFLGNLIWQIVAGVAIGYLIGRIGPFLLNKVKLETAGFYYVLAIGLCFLSYGLADQIHGNGFLAVFVTGICLGNIEFIYKQGIARFIEGTANTSHVLLFLMLGLLVQPQEIFTFWRQGVVISLLMIFIARPVAVYLCTAFWPYTMKEKIFLCWGGIKGAVPIVLGTFPLVAGIEQGQPIFNVVFFAVLLSALLQGATMDIAAKKLGLLAGKKKRPLHSLELVSLAESQCELVEFEVPPESYLAGKKLEELALPESSLVTAIVRQQDIVTPRGNTELLPRDLLYVLVRYEDKEELLTLLQL